MRKKFEACKNLEELKNLYRNLSKKHHPDVGGDTETMKEVNALYSEYAKKLEEEKEDSQKFTDLIDEVLKHNVNVDIVGTWVWVYGEETKAIKETFKSMRVRWSAKHKKWYLGTFSKRKKGAFL